MPWHRRRRMTKRSPALPAALRVGAGQTPFLCYSSSPMLQHRLVVAPRSGIRRAPHKRHRIYGREYLGRSRSWGLSISILVLLVVPTPEGLAESVKQSAPVPQVEASLEQILSQVHRDMHEAMVLSYAVNDSEETRLPTQILASVNTALSHAENAASSGLRLARLKARPDYERRFEALTQHVSGVKSLNSGRFLAARQQLSQASAYASADSSPATFAIVRNALAYAQFFTGQPQAAFDTIGNAIQVAEKKAELLFPMLLYNRAWLNLHTGALDQARADFRVAAEHSRQKGRFLWEVMAFINLGIVELTLGENQQAQTYLSQARQTARQLKSNWYEEMASYYLEIAHQQAFSQPLSSRSATKPSTPQRVIGLLQSALGVISPSPEQDSELTEGARVRVGSQNAQRGQFAVVMVSLDTASGVEVGSLDVTVSFPSESLQFVQVDEVQPEQIRIETDSTRSGRVRIGFRRASTQVKSLPTDLLAFLIFQVAGEAEPGDVPLEVSARGTAAGSANRALSPLDTVDGQVQVLPPQSCYMYNHPPTRPPEED